MRKLPLISLFVLLISHIVIAQETATEPIITRTNPPNPAGVQLVPIMDGFNRPIYLTHAGDGSNRLFVMEQGGKIFIIKVGVLSQTPFLDVTNLMTWDVNAGGYTERGLLGLAFHPKYAENGQFYINYTDKDGATIVARYTVSPDNPDVANPSSAQIILTQNQPYPNHNGGMMAFGPDGYLYISLGDGGSANDPLATGQNPADWLGSILRIDVDSASPYAVPSDNPFVNGGGAPEVWNYGLRNVWRFSFDRATGDFYIADVGQGRFEEVNFQPVTSTGGENYGWSVYEASISLYGRSADATGKTMPIAEYSHDEGGCSITGGYVYRGAEIPDLQGVYVYGDWCSGKMWAAYRDDALNWQSALFIETGVQISSFGEDEAGELYMLDYGGQILRFTIVP